MYTEYRQDRPVISINDGQDWTLPEVPAADYSDKIINDAKDFSDVAMIVLSRTGGEGTDLPIDMGPIMDGSTMDIGTKYTKGTYTNNSKDYDDFEDGQSYLELSKTEQDLVDLVCSNFDDVIVCTMVQMRWSLAGQTIMSRSRVYFYVPEQVQQVLMHSEISYRERSTHQEKQQIHGLRI